MISPDAHHVPAFTPDHPMNPAQIRAVHAHRLWPMPRRPWIMTQVWQKLLFAHWPVAVEVMHDLIPPPLTLDTFDGQAWLSIAPFLATGTRPPFLPPVPLMSRFLEMNVRTYVTYEDKPGILFFSLDASNPVIVFGAKTFFYLPYRTAAMKCDAQGQRVEYESRHQDGAFRANYGPVSDPYHAEPGSLDHWLVERYCLYTTDPQGRPYRGEIHHPPWPLQTAEAEITENTVSPVPLDGPPPRLHYAERLDTLIWPLQPIN